MDLRQIKRLRDLRQSYLATKFQLIVTELDMAVTFCQLATSTKDLVKAERNIENAKRAFTAATHFLQRIALTTEMRNEVFPRLSRVTAMLRSALSFTTAG